MTDGRERTFAVLRLTGERFTPPGVPVAALPEIVAYQDIVAEVAKALFRRSHPGRHRVPKGFFERLGLRLEAVDVGSAMPVLTRSAGPGDALFDSVDEFDAARDLVAEMLAAAAERGDLPDGFPLVPPMILRRFGQTLEKDEGLQVGTRESNWSSVPVYTQLVRRRLLLRRLGNYTDAVAATGILIDLAPGRGTFTIRTEAGVSITANYDNDNFAVVREAAEPTPKRLLRVEGVAVFGPDEQPQRFESVSSVAFAEDSADQEYERARADIAEHAGLQPGWLGDGEGERVTGRALQVCATLLGALESSGSPAPYVYPTPAGGLHLEWTVQMTEVSAEVTEEGALLLQVTDTTSGRFDGADLASDVGIMLAVEWLQPKLTAA
ncbi:hypothetical protein [Frankia sp. Cr2]|uniref:hypothetical protein n=1 Tax=Frankia sp. Cr2 TaxID=3073932 RepID=UPI002AD34E04|nr:hypothetical protein [Frankia sp. Cr2]